MPDRRLLLGQPESSEEGIDHEEEVDDHKVTVVTHMEKVNDHVDGDRDDGGTVVVGSMGKLGSSLLAQPLPPHLQVELLPCFPILLTLLL